jgi:hypothetical protein
MRKSVFFVGSLGQFPCLSFRSEAEESAFLDCRYSYWRDASEARSLRPPRNVSSQRSLAHRIDLSSKDLLQKIDGALTMRAAVNCI